MEKDYYKQFEPLFGSWYIKDILGEGGFGSVYEIERKELGTIYKSALKAITIPKNQSDVKSIMADGMTKEGVTTYYKEIVQELHEEIVLMAMLRGNSNIVSYEDHLLHEHEDGIGWDILIRMELLTSLYDHILKNKMTRRDVIRLGIDICKALELCQKYNIVHRDVKPENIFISNNGDFKLGDFGIARTIEKTNSSLSKKGTYTYMAPEIYHGKHYDSTVDIYSLGIVMYRLLNANRTPFLPPYPEPITHSGKESALQKRFSGQQLPPPCNAEGRLREIILKACAFHPEKRYNSPGQMRLDLEAILYDRSEAELIYPNEGTGMLGSEKYVTATKPDEAMELLDDDTEKTTAFETYAAVANEAFIIEKRTKDNSFEDEAEVPIKDLIPTLEPVFDGNNEKESADIKEPFKEESVSTKRIQEEDFQETKSEDENEEETGTSLLLESERIELPRRTDDKNKAKISLNPKIIGSAIAVAVILIVAAIFLLSPKGVSDISGIEESVQIVQGESIAFSPKAESKDDEQYEVTYKIEDEKIAYVKEGKLYGKAPGETKMTLIAGKYTETVDIKVQKAKVKEIKNLDSKITLTEGETCRLSPKISPKEAADTKIQYTSSKKSVATVSSSGKITAKAAGMAIITVKAGDVVEEVKVTVEEEVEEVYYEEPTPTPEPITDTPIDITEDNSIGGSGEDSNGESSGDSSREGTDEDAPVFEISDVPDNEEDAPVFE